MFIYRDGKLNLYVYRINIKLFVTQFINNNDYNKYTIIPYTVYGYGGGVTVTCIFNKFQLC